ncbi:MAG: glycine-rich domain-containing protein [Stellaceae bacterium]
MRKSSVVGVLLSLVGSVPAWAQGLDLSTQNGLLEDRANAGTTGTTLYTLTKINGGGLAVIASTSDSNGVRGVCVGGCGTSGNAQIATTGTAALLLDGTGMVGDFVQVSSTTGGYGHDTGATTCPSSGQTVGKIVAAGGPSSSYYVALGPFGCGSGGATGFTNVYTGHGTYTWNKPSGISWVTAYCLGAGGGGASGAVSTSAYSGGGGGGAAAALSTIPASLVSSTVTVTVGQGGAGGAASTTSANNVGLAGTNSSFGSFVVGYGGTGAPSYNGGAATWTYGANASPSTLNLQPDDWSGRAGSSAGGSGLYAGLFGGASGGSSGNNTTGLSGSGGITPSALTPPAGGANTTGSTTSNGTSGSNPANPTIGGANGSGGAGGGNTGTTASTAGTGGAGGYGAGGGGGGAVIATTGTSGAGGAGGDGICIVYGN